MGRLLVANGVTLGSQLSWHRIRILEVLKSLALSYPFDVTIEGVGAGGYYIAVKDRPNDARLLLLRDLQNGLYREPRRFSVLLEDVGGPHERIFVQVRPGDLFTYLDYLDSH